MPLIGQLVDTVYMSRVYLFVGDRASFREYLLGTWGRAAANRVPKKALGAAVWATAPSACDGAVDGNVYFVWLGAWGGQPHDYGVLAHECYHTVRAVYYYLGVAADDDEEAVAYYLDTMVRQFAEMLRDVGTIGSTPRPAQ